MEEPSVLDYIKSKFSRDRDQRISLPDFEEEEKTPQPEVEKTPKVRSTVPWRSITGLALAFIGQWCLEPAHRNLEAGLFFYFLSIAWIIWAIYLKEWAIAEIPDLPVGKLSLTFRPIPLGMGLVVSFLALLAFGGNQFNLVNLFLWLVALLFVIFSFWEHEGNPWFTKFLSTVKQQSWDFHITRWHILFLLVIITVLFFRFYRINTVLGEMFSDQAEKLYDVSDVLDGQYSIFFPRNTGREAIQFYLTAAIAVIFKTGLSFMSLKLGTVLLGVCTLPFVYLLGKEIGNRRIGLFALLLTGMAYWPNVISRVGLRFPLYPLFVAPVIYYLIRGLRRSNRNDIIKAGIALGIGLHGYSPIRFLPFVVVIAVLIYIIHKQSIGNRKEALGNLVILALVACIFFLPLARYWLENPDMFGYRAFTRLAGTERAIPGSVIMVFMDNLWKASIMPFWDNGQIWVHSIPGRPALDVVSAALYLIGLIVVVVRYIKKREWTDLFLLISIPLLMMPSILSLAFPEENPSLNRTGGAYIPIFIIAAIGLDSFYQTIKNRMPERSGTMLASASIAVILLISVAQNFDLVFRQYDQQFMAGAWNTSQIGQVVREFSDTLGSPDAAYVVPYPYWVDTRLVGI
ncbi:MAG: glycosyltransferase family 39 protein, partial [Anaerolineaceae bacterium]|nr:glycosyltransferase family 39 protein [Anaerolineaceae bacterium]